MLGERDEQDAVHEREDVKGGGGAAQEGGAEDSFGVPPAAEEEGCEGGETVVGGVMILDSEIDKSYGVFVFRTGDGIFGAASLSRCELCDHLS